jgi:hypothetical protein
MRSTGTGIYANIQSSDSLFQFVVDGTAEYVPELVPTPANCSFDWSKTGLDGDADHEFSIQALGPVLQNSYWTLGLGGLACVIRCFL